MFGSSVEECLSTSWFGCACACSRRWRLTWWTLCPSCPPLQQTSQLWASKAAMLMLMLSVFPLHLVVTQY